MNIHDFIDTARTLFIEMEESTENFWSLYRSNRFESAHRVSVSMLKKVRELDKMRAECEKMAASLEKQRKDGVINADDQKIINALLKGAKRL